MTTHRPVGKAEAMKVLITGASRAIGAATATVLMRRGHDVVATARDPELLGNVPATLRLLLDVRDAASVRAALDEAGDLDAVVNNAALTGTGPLESFPLDEIAAIFETNALGALRVIQPLLPRWRERGGGVIVNVSSVEGRVAPPLSGPTAPRSTPSKPSPRHSITSSHTLGSAP